MDIRVLGVCNLACRFCFGPRHDIRPTRLHEIADLLPNLLSAGVERIVFTGGEPLLSRHFPSLLKRARELGFRTVLSTNGSLLPQRHCEVLPHLDWIALPLDGPDRATQDMLRPGRRSSYEAVLRAFNLVRNSYPDVRVKLGTVIQPSNHTIINMIPKQVTDAGLRPDIWKLYQVSFSNYAKDHQQELTLTPSKFEKSVVRCLRAAASHAWRSAVYRNDTRDGQYLFIEPSGDAMIIADGNEVAIGNILDDFAAVTARWTPHVDERRLERNADSTYF